MAEVSSATRYWGYKIEGTPGTTATNGFTYLRCRRQGTSMRWLQNYQEEDFATGDIFHVTDEVVTNPYGDITVSIPFFPDDPSPNAGVSPAKGAGLRTLLTACGLASGVGAGVTAGITAPQSLTFLEGNGIDERRYGGCQCVSLELNVPSKGDAMWTLRFVGSNMPAADPAGTADNGGSFAAPGAMTKTQASQSPQAYIMPYSQPIRLFNLDAASLIGNASIAKFNSVRMVINTGITPIFYSGQLSSAVPLDSVCDFVQNDPSVELVVSVAFQNRNDVLKFLKSCETHSGTGVDAMLQFESNCPSHATNGNTWIFQILKGYYDLESLSGPDKGVVLEDLTIKALRPDTDPGTGSAFSYISTSFITAAG